MALNPVDLQCIIYFNTAGDEVWFEDMTDLYSPSNLEGWGLPGGPPTSAVTSFSIVFSYTGLPVNVTYNFTVASNVITAATATFGSGTPVNILSELVSTTFPFTSANPFQLNGDYGLNLPELEDMVLSVEYEAEGTYTLKSFDYTTSDQALYNFNTNCCISQKYVNLKLSNLNPNDMSPVMIADGYMQTAIAANANGLTDMANDYIQRAKALCDTLDCNCGC